MDKLISKFISVFILIVFSVASGPGQLIHAAFHDHDHNYTIQSNVGITTLNPPHTYCLALQLTLPEFFESGTCNVQTIVFWQDHSFAEPEADIPHLISVNNSDRAPPVFA